jgi:hypothetical protein
MAARTKFARALIIGLRAAWILTTTGSASAETLEQKQGCIGDAFQFCSSTIPNRDRLFSCLVANEDVLSACLVALCCSGPFANRHQIGVSDSHLPSDHGSRDLARSQLALPTLDILPHRALPPAEPFVLPSTSFPTGEIRAKWSDLEARISADEKMLAICRSDESTCSQAERRFLSIVELA